LTFLAPSILDAVLNTLEVLIDTDKAYVPIGFEKFIFFKKPKNVLQCKVKLKKMDKDNPLYDQTADLVLLDSGEIVFIAENLRFKAVSNLQSKKNNLLFSQQWTHRHLRPSKIVNNTALLIGPSSLFNHEAQHYLQSLQSAISWTDTIDGIDRHLQHNENCHNIVYFWQTVTTDCSVQGMTENCKNNHEFILNLIRLLENKYIASSINLFFVTQGAQILANDNPHDIEQQNLLQSTLHGFNVVLNNENPKYKSKTIDFDCAADADFFNSRLLIKEIFSYENDTDFQIAYRGNNRFVRRLTSLVKDDANSGRQSNNFQLDIADYGTFASIQRKPIAIEPPQGDQILVKVQAAGLNFKDVLNALGLLKQHAESTGVEYVPLPLGFECAGIVIESGESAQFSPGDDVIISHIGCMQQFITVSSKTAVKKPKNIRFDEAAGLATAYITAYHALHNLAKIKKNDKILIHAAAGGVGQAAIQLAQQAKAEIFATASKGKWDFLKQQGIKHIMNSRDLSFGKTLLENTDSVGVDIVLNSLNKQYIPVGLGTLAKKGRFVEIGKIDIWSHDQVKEFREDVAHYNFDLSELPKEELTELNKTILEKIAHDLEKGEISPLPVSTYSLDQLEDAFGVLSKGENIGKIILVFGDVQHVTNTKPVSMPAVIKADRTYLITGGYGALGMHAAKWLAQEGAEHIALVGRTAATAKKLKEISSEINNQKVNLISLQGDISRQDDLLQMFTELKTNHPSLGGVIHAAGTLQDAPISSQTWPIFDKVFQPKVYGLWNLHQQVCLQKDIDFFIGYSSVASVVGSVGQANYSAANAFIDSLMNWRALAGKHGLAVNWGPWGEVGMAAKLSDSQIKSIEEKGINFLKPNKAMSALSKAIASMEPQVIINEFNWSKYTDNLSSENLFYANVVSKEKSSSVKINIEDIKQLPIQECYLQVQQIIRSKLAAVLHFDNEDDIELDEEFSHLGLDSLVSVEFKNIIEKTFVISLRASDIVDYPSIPRLAEFILAQLFPDNKEMAMVDKKSGKRSNDRFFTKLMNKIKSPNVNT
ncbi:MAG: SDR family NAD(P)-dependent oxidoreductase, partial [Gammaproteobacteria bacterium]|nr:SDR family NAD(P)-dependent oxidoreductase [Gammaproteobacteria bacterium]